MIVRGDANHPSQEGHKISKPTHLSENEDHEQFSIDDWIHET